MPRASAADAAETARRILDVATAHFAARGYATASVDDIARAAGVTRGAVYHHYESKPRLFTAVAAAQQERVTAAILAATAQSSAAAALRDGSHAFLDAITVGTAARVLLVDGPAVLGWEQWRRLDATGPEQELRAGLREAGIPTPLRDALTAALSGAMNELALWLAARPDDVAARHQAHRALDALLDAVDDAS
ncbi:TetR family transcriptional regulator [Microbacterium sp. p3-SID338]|uniref:TetR/AcrR family transcriptional regulator n=1 Tax=unclassified Microbacterium TaxID=2609290 RepID=UPI0007896EAF|nr:MULTISPECIES: TetR/AcrR family transcriptional regulator [unclassified Microbacterium]KYJ98414.1 TetR family transcriptional regulator [Microbacterium sp. CH1]MCT1395436.1 TetR family transcriptional regulator [Microbacterium sp. p3-SID338]PMC06694.1 TetR family transcriptional regulator [Microbacterium sp. UMB0228]